MTKRNGVVAAPPVPLNDQGKDRCPMPPERPLPGWPAGVPEWQPIDTAPRDGTRILAYAPPWRDDDQTIAVVYWWVHEWDSYEPADDTGLYRKVEHKMEGYWEGGPGSPWHATYWLPLPPAPCGRSPRDGGAGG